MNRERPSVFYSAHVRLDRAKEHLDDLEAQIDQFFRKKPYTKVAEPDPDGVHEIHKFKFTERLPFRWRVLATEVIEHARASLDHATFAAHLAARGHPDARYVAFPFGRTPADLDNSMKGRSKELLPEIQTLLRSLDCYEGGNELLYILNNLSNVTKHALIALMVGVAQELQIEGPGLFTAQPQFPNFVAWDRMKNEVKYARTKRGVGFEHKCNLTFFVAIQDKEATSPVSAQMVLNAMLDESRRVVTAIEAKCRKLGLDVGPES
jgi:hypothetical protein